MAVRRPALSARGTHTMNPKNGHSVMVRRGKGTVEDQRTYCGVRGNGGY